MGKKKDKASKSKKKSKAASVVEPDMESRQEPETGSIEEPEVESIQYAEQVTAGDVMELITTISHDLHRLDESNQLLQQQVAQSQKAPQRQHTVLKIITIILGIGIIAIGYSSAKMNSRMNESTGIDSADMNKMASRITTMDTSIRSLTSDVNKINASIGKLSASVTAINQNVDKVASDVNKINTGAASTPQQSTQYVRYPMDPWRRW